MHCRQDRFIKRWIDALSDPRLTHEIRSIWLSYWSQVNTSHYSLFHKLKKKTYNMICIICSWFWTATWTIYYVFRCRLTGLWVRNWRAVSARSRACKEIDQRCNLLQSRKASASLYRIIIATHTLAIPIDRVYFGKRTYMISITAQFVYHHHVIICNLKTRFSWYFIIIVSTPFINNLYTVN